MAATEAMTAMEQRRRASSDHSYALGMAGA